MLYLPWFNQKTALDDQDCEQIFKSKLDVINNNILKFSKIPDDTIAQYMEHAEARNENYGQEIPTEEKEEGDQPVNGNNPDDFSMYALPEEEGLEFNARCNGQSSSTGSTANGVQTAEEFARPDKIGKSEYHKLISVLNMERNCFNHVLNYIQHEDCKQNPLRLFITGGAVTGKRLLIEVLYQALVRFCDVGRERDMAKGSVVWRVFTGKATYNIVSPLMKMILKVTSSIRKASPGDTKAQSMICLMEQLYRIHRIFISYVSSFFLLIFKGIILSTYTYE